MASGLVASELVASGLVASGLVASGLVASELVASGAPSMSRPPCPEKRPTEDLFAVARPTETSIAENASPDKAAGEKSEGEEKKEEPAPWRRRWSLSAGGAAWQRDFSMAKLQGFEARGGFELQFGRDNLRLTASLDAINIIQGATNIEVNTVVASALGGGFRKAYAAILAGGLGYQWQEVKIKPYFIARGGLAIGHEELRTDIRLITDTETTALTGTIYGYDQAQAIILQGRLLSPSFSAEIGFEPLHFGQRALGLAVVVTSWPRTDTVSFGIVARFCNHWKLQEKKETQGENAPRGTKG